MKQQTVEESYF